MTNIIAKRFAQIKQYQKKIPKVKSKLLDNNTPPKERELCLWFLRKYSLKYFIPYVFGICDKSATYQHNWHISALAEQLEECFFGDVKRLIVNIPPRSLKSISGSVAFVMWILGHVPEFKILCVSKKQETGEQLSMLSRQVGLDEGYQKMFPKFAIAGDQNQKGSFNTTLNGSRETKTSLSIPTGKGYNFILFDDFLSGGMTKGDMEKAIALYPQFYSRLQPKDEGRIIAIEQRLGYNDFTAYLSKQWTQYKHIVLPAIETSDRIINIASKSFERKKGDLLNDKSKDWSYEGLDVIKQEMGSLLFETQYQQNPSVEGGSIIKDVWLQEEELATIRERKFDNVYLSCDTAFKDKTYNDPSALLVFGVMGGKSYLLDVYVERLTYPMLLAEIKRIAKKYNTDAVLIEDKASGQSIIQELRQESPQYSPIAINIKGDKMQRLSSASSFIEAGNLVLPTDAEWLVDYRNELLRFPNGKHDDQVDATSQFINWYKARLSRPDPTAMTNAMWKVFS